MAEFMTAEAAQEIARPALRRYLATQYCEAENGIMDRVLEASKKGFRWIRYDFGRFDAKHAEPVEELLTANGYKVKRTPHGEGYLMDINWDWEG